MKRLVWTGPTLPGPALGEQLVREIANDIAAANERAWTAALLEFWAEHGRFPEYILTRLPEFASGQLALRVEATDELPTDVRVTAHPRAFSAFVGIWTGETVDMTDFRLEQPDVSGPIEPQTLRMTPTQAADLLAVAYDLPARSTRRPTPVVVPPWMARIIAVMNNGVLPPGIVVSEAVPLTADRPSFAFDLVVKVPE